MTLSTTTRILTAGVLLSAAVLKGYQLSTEPVGAGGILSNRWLLAVGVEIEIILAAWLLSGFQKRLSWQVAGAVFAVFSMITLYKGVSGESSCGCFGKVEMSPWHTLILDVGVLAALIAFRRQAGRGESRSRFGRLRLSAAVVLAAAGCLTAGVSIASYQPATLSDDGVIIGDDRFVVLEPDRWIGKPLPLLSHIDAGAKLGEGRWTLLLYHHDCPHCREALPKIRKLARTFSSTSETERSQGRFALVEMPPYCPKDSPARISDADCTIARLSNKRDWFAVSPTLISLEDGKVSTVLEGDISVAQVAPVSIGINDDSLEPTAGGTHVVSLSPSANNAAHDFGYVKCKRKRSVVFKIPNRSDESVKIRKVRSECKCMLAPDPPKALAPGAKTSIRVDFVAPDKPMRYSKRILLQTESSERPTIVLRIEADVGRPLQSSPNVLDLGEIAPGSETIAQVTLTNHGDKPVQLAYGTSTSPRCVAMIPRRTVGAEGGKLSVPIAVRPGVSFGPGKAAVCIHTDCSAQPQVAIPIKYVVAGDTTPGSSESRPLARDTKKQ